METYKCKDRDKEGLAIPYAAGFKDYQGVNYLFYIEQDESGIDVVVRMLNELLKLRHNGCVLYVHNLSRFDSRIILAALGEMDSSVRCKL